MTLGVILGAGFSKAVNPSFPLVDELGEQVRDKVPDALTSAPPKFVGGAFERWLSRIAEPQPDLSDAANLGNARDFAVVTTAIHELMVNIEAEVFRTEIPWWLLRLVGLLHAERATVVTFNYDTVIEAVAARAPHYGDSANLTTYSLTDGIPPTPPTTGMHGPSFTHTFRLLKLHGSLDTYWVRGDSAGTSITRVADSIWAPNLGMNHPNLNIARRAPGRVPFIVPPASAKSAFFANPITRQLWQTASQRLSGCDQIAVIGYSIPMTDIVASAMLVTAQKASGARIDIVNPRPDPVRDLLVDGSVPAAAVRIASDSCEGYVDQLERQVSASATAAIKSARAKSRPLTVAGPAGTVWPVVGLDVRGSDIDLRIADSQNEVALRDTSTWKTSTELFEALERSRAEHLTVTVKGERAHVLSYVAPISGLEDLAILVPTAVRLPL
ncbi:MAG: hypothetical protein ACYC1E_11915 [Propionibacteriaceae bacterium]